MSKYIVDIPDGVEWGVVTCRTEDGFYTRNFDSLEELTADYINEHFGDLQDTAYQKGLEDAWDAAKKIVTWPDRSLVNSDTFDLDPGESIFTKYSASEAIERLKSYEDDKIKRGDIVNIKGCSNDDSPGVVTKVWKDNCYIMWGDGSGGTWSKDSVVKTGKHIDVDKFLEEIAT